jgi:ADP-ribose pyrophosphatase YjhB (NUDIX family)
MKLGVNVAIIQEGKILLTQREDFEVWCLPGGAVDPGESLAEAACREVREEIGLEVELTGLVGVYSIPEEGIGSGHIAVFTAHPAGGTLQLDPREVVAADYFAAGDLPELTLDWHRQRILDAFNGAGGSLYRRQRIDRPFPALSRAELYALRDRSGLTRQEFFVQHYMATASPPATPIPPRTFLWRPEALIANRHRIDGGDPLLQPAYRKLLADAEKAMNAGPWSVMDKAVTPPSGDKHDYYSVGPYWWPNPDTADGLPYVRRDGETNPERARYDSDPLKALVAAVDTLALAYFFSGADRFAARAATLLRVWFLNESTRMNPHLDYGQAIPGICDGRGIGIIDTLQLSRTVDAIGLLATSSQWTDSDQAGMAEWFRRYSRWLLESKNGQDEARQHNNHGVWYDVQLAAFALFARMDDIARTVLVVSAPQRIAGHIAADGSQPYELARTRSLSYSTMNLRGLMDLARLGEHMGLDLWHFVPRTGGGLCAAVDYLVHHAVDSEWTQAQITPFDYGELLPILRQAARVYDNVQYEDAISRLPAEIATQRTQLLLHPGDE